MTKRAPPGQIFSQNSQLNSFLFSSSNQHQKSSVDRDQEMRLIFGACWKNPLIGPVKKQQTSHQTDSIMMRFALEPEFLIGRAGRGMAEAESPVVDAYNGSPE
ncbi:hypothetical protein N7519_001633 [Penicillium mononematosum]|uniref:uncharacterized protein n=1 Tax=Penicillium mononematosum TaxID=268346 RepID=UPI0025466199|nr:uncharacterized protein N7519_001633 [Penicillium mononematosum]KAJ6191612.1 hypothetical protein N7519_001633 [Penicillium mononematosum]